MDYKKQRGIYQTRNACAKEIASDHNIVLLLNSDDKPPTTRGGENHCVSTKVELLRRLLRVTFSPGRESRELFISRFPGGKPNHPLKEAITQGILRPVCTLDSRLTRSCNKDGF